MSDELIRFAYTDKKISAWGGMRIMKELLVRSGVLDCLKELDLPKPGSNAGYDPIAVLESFMVCVWLGGVRFAHTAFVRFDEVLKEIFGWKRVVPQGGISTFTRFFRRFTQKRNTAVFPALFGWFFTQIKLRRYTIDLDSSVLTRYGEQQGAEVGYNPTKPGRASHHPLIAFVSEVRMVANAWLRSGDSATTNNVFGFLRETIDRVLPEKEIGLLRADSGFFGGKLFEFLEERKINYIIACRMYPPLKRRIRALKDWVVVDRGIEIAEFDYETSRWFGASRRMVVVRQSVAARPTAGGKTLFDDDQALADYRYQCYVTNLDLPVVSVWQLYRGRSDAENRIKELKYDFGMKGFSLNDFWATEAAFRMVCFSYNLMALFRQVILKADSVPMLSTLRLKCFAIGSYLRTKGREKILMLSVKMERRAWMDGLFSELATFTQPFPLRI